MSKIESVNSVDIHEINGDDAPMINGPKLIIKNHWNQRCFVIVKIDDKELTVSASDLIKAITNSQNVHS